MKKKAISQITLLGVTAIILYIFYLLPVAPGDFYTPFHIANLFFPNFGIDFRYATVSGIAKSMITFYTFSKILLLILSRKVVEYYQVTFILGVLFRTLGYILLFSIVDPIKKYRVPTAIAFAVITKFPGIPVFLLSSIIFSLEKIINQKVNPRYLCVYIILLTMTTFYWHTLSAVSTFVIMSYLGLVILIKKNRSTVINLIIISTIVVVSSWLYLRATNMLKVALLNFLRGKTLLSFHWIKQGLFSAGSLIPSQYRFDWYFPLRTTYINIARWLTYGIAYFILIKLSLNLLSKKNKPLQRENVIIVSLLLADIVDKFAHYFAIRSIGMTVWTVLLYPIFITFFFSKIPAMKSIYGNKHLKRWALFRNLSLMIIALLIIISTSLTSGYYIYTTATQLPSRNTHFLLYYPSFLWVSSNIQPNTTLLSDSDTAGYYEIIYAKKQVYRNHPLYFRDVRLNEYEALYKGIYHPLRNQIIVINTYLYREHLVFGSLRYWDRFKPLAPRVMFKNNIQVVYNSNVFIVGM